MPKTHLILLFNVALETAVRGAGFHISITRVNAAVQALHTFMRMRVQNDKEK